MDADLESVLHSLAPIPTTDDPPPEKSPLPPRVGLSQHSSIWYLARLQRYSSYAFSLFAALHITNTSLIPLLTRSVPASEPYLLLTRPFYQSPAAEQLLVLFPLSAHVLSGVALRLVRRNQNAARFGEIRPGEKRAAFRQFWPRLSAISKLGFAVTPLVAGHVFVNRWIPQRHASAGNVELRYVSHAFARHVKVSYVGYAALIAAVGFHMTWGWAKWMGWTPEQVYEAGAEERGLKKKRRWYVIQGVALAVTGLWMAGSLGVIAKGGEASGWVGRQYDEMYRMIPLVGRWM